MTSSTQDNVFDPAQWDPAITKVLSGEPPISMKERMLEIANSPYAAGRPDQYCDGGKEIERRVASLLGKERALWFPTGTMAQQVALRIWAERAHTRNVAVHPLQHTQVHEKNALREVSGLNALHLTTEERQPVAEDLEALTSSIAAVVVELPLQELGYVLPDWDNYKTLSIEARQRGIRVHVDGARLWEAQYGFRKSMAAITEWADSVYVSAYKAIGGLFGGLLVGSANFISEAQVWRTRYGGDLYRQFPAIVGALDGLDNRTLRMSRWHEHAATIADGLRRLPRVRLVPDPPHICEFFVSSDLSAELLNRIVAKHASETGRRWLHGWWTSGDRAMCEVIVRDGALAWSAEDVERVGLEIIKSANDAERSCS